MSLFIKKSRDFFQDLNKKGIKGLFPVSVHFELTYKCNLNCIHCCIVRDNRRKELKFEEICSILDQLKEAGCIHLVFTGGELFTRDDILDVLSYARGNGFAIGIITNAALITPFIANKLKKLKIRSASVSLYGGSEKTYKKTTGSSEAFQQTIEGIKLLVKNISRVSVKVILLKYNIDEYPHMMNLANSLGAYSLHLGYVLHTKDNGSCEPMQCEIPTSSMLELVLNYHLKNFKKTEWLNMFKGRNGPAMPTCGAGRSTYAISPYGDLYPCLTLKIKGFNLREKSLFDIVHYDDNFDRLRPPQFLNIEECKNCELRSFCSICYVRFYKERYFNKSLDAACRHARFNKKLYYSLRLLQERRRISNEKKG